MVPGESANRGEWVQLDLPKAEVDKIGMVVGWAKTEETFKDYARIKEVQLQIFTYNEDDDEILLGKVNASFEDKMEMQIVDIDNFEVGSGFMGGKVKINVVDLYEGRDYPNLAVSEMKLYLKEFDTQLQLLDTSDESGAHLRDLMLDDNSRSFWAAPADGASVEFEASGFSLSSVGIVPGPRSHARPRKVEVHASGQVVKAELPDDGKEHWVEIPGMAGYNGNSWGSVVLKIVETWPGSSSTDVGIAEMRARATSYEGL
jgi:hypothetical protein